VAAFLEDHPRYRAAMAAERIPPPRNVIVELTSSCNLRCIMCPRTVGNPRTEPNRRVSEEVLELVVLNVVPYVERVDVVGDGEAFLTPRLFFELLRQANLLRVPVTACSNGHLLGEEILTRLITGGLADLNVSLDAATPETYERIRCAPFHRVVTNLRKLRRLKRLFGVEHPRLHLTMVAMTGNIQELPGLVELAGELGAASVTVQAMGEESDELAGQSAFHHQPDQVARYFDEARLIAEGLGITLARWPGTFRTAEELAEPPEGGWRKDCFFPWQAPYITAGGDVRPCCAALPALGNLLHASFREIWQGKAYRDLREQLAAGELPAECRDCPGTGWIAPTPLDRFPTVSEPSRFFALGFHAPESDGANAFRWFGERSLLLLPTSGEQGVLLRVQGGEGLPPGRKLTVRVGGQPLGSFPFPEEPRPIVVTVPGRTADQGLMAVELQVDGHFRPVEQADPGAEATTDARRLAARLLELIPIDLARTAQFDDGLILVGCDLPSEHIIGAGRLTARLVWQVLSQPAKNYRVFVHLTPAQQAHRSFSRLMRLVGADRERLIQADHEPLAGRRPTSSWLPGEFLVDEFEIPLPDQLEPGAYTLLVGLVTPEDNRRLRVRASDWRTSGGRVAVAELRLLRGPR
jgi:MoaA/NifB/PqqE/SkfB family radical SAM enzyme